MSNTSSLLARDEFKDKFDLLIDEHLPTTCPAMSVCAIHRGETVLQAARGWIDPDTRRLSVQTDTLFDLASVTKIIVETSFLALVEAGKVRLESKLADVIPEFAAINPREISGGQDPHTREFLSIDAEYSGRSVDVSQVTFKHLLTHSSGLPPWRAVYLWQGNMLRSHQLPATDTKKSAGTMAWQPCCASPLLDQSEIPCAIQTSALCCWVRRWHVCTAPGLTGR